MAENFFDQFDETEETNFFDQFDDPEFVAPPTEEPNLEREAKRSFLGTFYDNLLSSGELLLKGGLTNPRNIFAGAIEYGFSDDYTGGPLSIAPKEASVSDEASQTFDSIVKGGLGVGTSVSRVAEDAGLLSPGASKSMAESYEAVKSDPRIAEMIQYATEEGEKAPDGFQKAFRGTKAMLSYIMDNPMAGVNLIAEQVPSILAALPAGRLAQLGTRGVAALFKASPKLAGALGVAGFGAGFNSAAVVYNALGANYSEGLQKFNGDEEKAREYAYTKTINEVPANAIAGAFLAIDPTKATRGLRKFRAKAPKTAVAGNVLFQSSVQATGGVLGATQAAESVGEEISLGEQIAEGLFEFSLAPVELALSRGEVREIEAQETAYNQFVNQFEEGILDEKDLSFVRDTIEGMRSSGNSFEQIQQTLLGFGLQKARDVGLGKVKPRVKLKTAGTQEIVSEPEKINLFDTEGNPVQGTVETTTEAGVVKANVGDRSVIVDQEDFSTTDSSSPEFTLETIADTRQVKDLNDEELNALGDELDATIERLGDAGPTLPTYYNLVRDINAIRMEQSRRGITPTPKKIDTPTLKPTKPRLRATGVVSDVVDSPVNTSKSEVVQEILEGSEINVPNKTTAPVEETEVKETEATTDETVETPTVNTEQIKNELDFINTHYEDLTSEEKIDLFAKALRVVQSPELQGTPAIEAAEDILGRASKFQRTLAEEKVADQEPITLDTLNNSESVFSIRSKSVSEAGHIIPARSDLRPETDMVRRLNETMDVYSRGLMSMEDFIATVDKLLEGTNRRRILQRDKARVRRGGARLIKSRLNDAARRGEIDPKLVDLFEYVINQNPTLAESLAVSITKPRDDEQDVGGTYTPFTAEQVERLRRQAEFNGFTDYDPLAGIMRILKGNANPTTAVHELLHHMERMMPTDVQDSIRNLWNKEIKAFIKKLENEIIMLESAGVTADYINPIKLRIIGLKVIEAANAANNADLFELARAAFSENPNEFWDAKRRELGITSRRPVLYAELDYQFYNPSEFWAVNASEILEKRFDVKDSVIEKIKRWIKEFLDNVNGLLGRSSNDAVRKAMDKLLKGKIDSSIKTPFMLKGVLAQTDNTALDLKNRIDNQENIDTNKEGVEDSKSWLDKYINEPLSDPATEKAKLLPRKAILGSLDTFNILDTLRLSKIKSLNKFANSIEDIFSSLREEQQKIVQFGVEKIKRFASFVNDAPIAGELLQTLMTESSAIRFDPSAYDSLADALAKDRGLVLLRKQKDEGNFTEEDLDDANYHLGDGWQNKNADDQIKARTQRIRELMNDWKALRKFRRAPTEASKLINVEQYPSVVGEAQEIYKEMRDAYLSMLDLIEKTNLENLDKSGLGKEALTFAKKQLKRNFAAIRRAKPYFPLYRFGDFWVRVPSDSESRGLWTFENKQERDNFVKDLEQEMRETGEDIGQITVGDNRDSLRNHLEEVDDVIKEVFIKLDGIKVGDKDFSAQELTTYINQLKEEFLQSYLSTLPDRDLRTRMLRRKATPGYSSDQVRAFATYMGSAAAQLPRLKYRKDAQVAIDEAKSSIKQNPNQSKIEAIIAEIEGRVKLQFAPPNMSDLSRASESFISQLIFYQYLVGVDTALQNYSVLTTFAPAVLGTQYGYGKTLKTIAKYTTAALNRVSEIETKGLDTESLDKEVTPIEEFSIYNTPLVQNNPVIQAAYRWYNNKTGFNTNYINELVHYSSQPAKVALKDTLEQPNEARRFLNLASLPFRITERQTRELVFLSAFELAFDKEIKGVRKDDEEGARNAFDNAVRAAKRYTEEAAFNYDPSNRNFNRLVNDNKLFVSWAARQASRLGSFRFQAIGFLLKNLGVSLGLVRNIPIKERAKAFQKLLGLFTFGSITAGIPAATGSWGLFALISLVATRSLKEALKEPMEDRDRDEMNRLLDMLSRDNLQVWFYTRFVPETFGEKTFMAKLARGGIFNALTGYDFSSKLNLDFISPNLFKRRPTTVDAFIGNAAVEMFGVVGDRALGVADTLGTVSSLIGEGRLGDALYTLARDGALSFGLVSDINKAIKESKEGYRPQDPLGIKPEQISAVDTIMRMLGFKPEERAVTERSELLLVREQQKLEGMRSKLLKAKRDAFIKKQYEKDPVAAGDLEAAEKAIREFNKEYPELMITAKDEADAIDRAMESQTGILSRSGLSKKVREDIGKRIKKGRDERK